MQTVKYPIKDNIWRWFSTEGFGRIVCFKQYLNTEIMCDICNRSRLLAVRKQFSHDSTLWKLQEETDRKHTWKLAINWKRNNGVDEIHCTLMSPGLEPMENIKQLFKMKLRRKRSKVINLWLRQ